MAVSKRLRFEVLRRDNHACRYCGRSAPSVKLTVDHVIPVALGGGDEPTNLITACADCNGGKSSTPPDAAIVAGVEQDQVRWARAIEAAAAMQDDQQRVKEENWSEFTRAWEPWASVWQPGAKVAALPSNWKQSVEALRTSGLPSRMWPDIVEATMTAHGVQDHFRYCCGVAWRRVREIQERAREIVEQEDHELMQAILEGWRELGSVADVWCEAWRDASTDGIEPTETPQAFKDALGQLMKAGLSIEEMRKVAHRAGSNLDCDLMAHLSDGEV
jgi:hypothetical protein